MLKSSPITNLRNGSRHCEVTDEKLTLKLNLKIKKWLKKILGTLTLISSFVWLAFFLNGVDQNHYNFVFLIAGIINILLIVKTKFWKENLEKIEGIKTIRFLCIIIIIIINISLIFLLVKVMKSEFDLDDSDDVYLSILMFFSTLIPFVYLLKTSNSNNNNNNR